MMEHSFSVVVDERTNSFTEVANDGGKLERKREGRALHPKTHPSQEKGRQPGESWNLHGEREAEEADRYPHRIHLSARKGGKDLPKTTETISAGKTSTRWTAAVER